MQTDDLAIPEVKLIQNVGGTEAKSYGALPGQFYFSLTQEIIKGDEGFEVVIMKPAWKTRTYWGRTEIDDDPPICSSLDAVNSVNGDVCATACPYEAFTDAPYLVDAAERRTKCLPNYELMAVKVSDMMPILIRCTGISAQAAKELNTLLMFHRQIKNQTWKAKLKVTAIPKKTAAGEAFAIKFGQPQIIEDEATLIELKDLAKMLQLPVSEQPAQIEKTGEQVIQQNDNVVAGDMAAGDIVKGDPKSETKDPKSETQVKAPNF